MYGFFGESTDRVYSLFRAYYFLGRTLKGDRLSYPMKLNISPSQQLSKNVHTFVLDVIASLDLKWLHSKRSTSIFAVLLV